MRRAGAHFREDEIRYIGGSPPELEEALWFEGRTAVVITPSPMAGVGPRQRPLIGVVDLLT